MSALAIDCDRALGDRAPTQDEVAAHPNLALCTSILASSLAFINGSVVNVGLSAIGRGVGGGGADLSLVVNGYLLQLSSLMLLGGALGDRYGRKRMLVGGIGVFKLASLLCALAPSWRCWLQAGCCKGWARRCCSRTASQSCARPSRGRSVGGRPVSALRPALLPGRSGHCWAVC